MWYDKKLTKSKEFLAFKRRLYLKGRHSVPGQNEQFRHYIKTRHDDKQCFVCKHKDITLHRHRVIPGGPYEDSNIVILCDPCHKLIHKRYKETDAKTEKEFRTIIMLAEKEQNVNQRSWK